METAELKDKLHHYIENAKDEKLQAIFSMVKDEIASTYNHWDDENFIAELMERERSYLNGTSKTYTKEETASRAREAVKNLHK